MARLLLISGKSFSDKVDRRVGDIVGVFDDTHKFTVAEKEIFDIVDYPLDAATIKLSLNRKRTLFQAKSLEWSTEPPDEKVVWMDNNGDMKEIVTDPPCVARYDAATGSILENYSRYVENTTNTLKAVSEK